MYTLSLGSFLLPCDKGLMDSRGEVFFGVFDYIVTKEPKVIRTTDRPQHPKSARMFEFRPTPTDSFLCICIYIHIFI